jgi:integrase
MDQEEASAFLKAAAKDKFGLVFELALITGMRPEEYLGLAWLDVNLEARTITVKRGLIWIRKAGFKFGEPKTVKSRRTIPVPDALIAKLRLHRRQQLEQKLRLGTAYADHDLVFANEIGKPVHYRNLTQRHYEKILKATNLHEKGFVLYSLRHTCATLLLAAGENPKVVSERLGHSTVRMTLDTYSHVLPDMQRSASEKLGKMIYG